MIWERLLKLLIIMYMEVQLLQVTYLEGEHFIFYSSYGNLQYVIFDDFLFYSLIISYSL